LNKNENTGAQVIAGIVAIAAPLPQLRRDLGKNVENLPLSA
jgi:hypothetical protein